MSSLKKSSFSQTDSEYEKEEFEFCPLRIGLAVVGVIFLIVFASHNIYYSAPVNNKDSFVRSEPHTNDLKSNLYSDDFNGQYNPRFNENPPTDEPDVAPKKKWWEENFEEDEDINGQPNSHFNDNPSSDPTIKPAATKKKWWEDDFEEDEDDDELLQDFDSQKRENEKEEEEGMYDPDWDRPRFTVEKQHDKFDDELNQKRNYNNFDARLNNDYEDNFPIDPIDRTTAIKNKWLNDDIEGDDHDPADDVLIPASKFKPANWEGAKRDLNLRSVREKNNRYDGGNNWKNFDENDYLLPDDDDFLLPDDDDYFLPDNDFSFDPTDKTAAYNEIRSGEEENYFAHELLKADETEHGTYDPNWDRPRFTDEESGNGYADGIKWTDFDEGKQEKLDEEYKPNFDADHGKWNEDWDEERINGQREKKRPKRFEGRLYNVKV